MLSILPGRPVTDTPKYTTQLQAGLGLVPETFKLLAAWEPGMSGQDLFKAALASGDFPAVTARRLQNIVTEAFRSRYLTDGGAPAKLLKAVSKALSRDDFRSLCFLFTCRANPILAEFVRTVYWPRDLGVEDGLLAVRLLGRIRWTDDSPLVGDDGHPRRQLPAWRLRGFWSSWGHESRRQANLDLPHHAEGGVDSRSRPAFPRDR
jgi:hypothetical protein